MTELTVGLAIAAFALGVLAGTFLAQRLLANEQQAIRRQLLDEIAAVRALRIRLRGRG